MTTMASGRLARAFLGSCAIFAQLARLGYHQQGIWDRDAEACRTGSTRSWVASSPDVGEGQLLGGIRRLSQTGVRLLVTVGCHHK
jgi:hypothetical protein